VKPKLKIKRIGIVVNGVFQFLKGGTYEVEIYGAKKGRESKSKTSKRSKRKARDRGKKTRLSKPVRIHPKTYS